MKWRRFWTYSPRTGKLLVEFNTLLQKFEYNLNALKLILKGSILCGKVSIGICNKLRKLGVFLCPRSLLLAFNSHKKISQKMTFRIILWCIRISIQLKSYLLQIWFLRSLCKQMQYVLCYSIYWKMPSWRLQGESFSLGWFPVCCCVWIHHITSAGSSVF